MLLATDTCGRAACHMAATNDNIQALKEIWQWAMTACVTGQAEETAWHLAA